ncbi:Ras-related small GTP-binding family protein [Striga asiatica]|uniref:Ras-related small GTP-binding family protein n=1 Tax=Striga asiatica TaxID=4170 RepID=A0A5A7PFW9_STRAF|nr:Ras-related small GTP-binding family protein [Striga asiatica]
MKKRKFQFHLNIKKRILWRISILRRCMRSVISRFRACCWVARSAVRYRHLLPQPRPNNHGPAQAHVENPGRRDSFSDLVSLKIGLLATPTLEKQAFCVIQWYQEARKWNQARAYAKAMKGTLFFSSATYNINVNKIFKFVTAKLFNLSWNLERNLNIGEPIIDF